MRIAGMLIPRRGAAIFAAVALTLGGVAFTYVLPAALAQNGWGVTSGGCTVGLLVGLLLTFLGNGTITAFSSPRRKVPPAMISIPTSHGAPIVQTLSGYAYSSPGPAIRDELSLILIYYPDRPYSVFMDISTIDPADGSTSDSARWEVSREVLHDAAVRGDVSGVGDFRAEALGERRVRMRLMDSNTCTHGVKPHYDMYVSRVKVRSFLRRTLGVVPMGRESERLDIDGQLERMFA